MGRHPKPVAQPLHNEELACPTKIETPKHHEIVPKSGETAVSRFEVAVHMHLRSRGFVLAPPTCKSRVQSQYAWPRNLKPKFIAIQQFLANACNSTRKGLQYAETLFPGKQLSAFRGLDGTCILVHFHLVTHMKICVKMSLIQSPNFVLPVCQYLVACPLFQAASCEAVWTYRSLMIN